MDNVHIVSCSDDKTIGFWDVSEEQQLQRLKGHTDSVRCAVSAQGTPDVWATGGYDHIVKLWDFRTFENINNLDHGAPVEALLMFPNGSVVVSAGGKELKVWDILSGGKLLYTISRHQKAITSLALSSSGTQLLSGGLDRHVTVYDIADYSVQYSFTFPAPVLSIGLSVITNMVTDSLILA
jgi:U3 small nucleolar RNA-associated protein 15